LQDIPEQNREAKIGAFFETALRDYDAFHFHFGGTFFPDKGDLDILHKAGKKMVVHHHGSDARILSAARKNNPYVKVKPYWTEEKIRENQTKLSKYINHAIAIDHEIESYMKDYYKETHVIPNIVDIHKLQPDYPAVKQTPLIVHAPTNINLKGTEFVLDAVNKLKNKGVSFEFKLIKGLDHSETMELLSKADIVIDQLRIGAVGYLGLEAMALGKPVICYIREDLVDKYPDEFPIVNANPNNITEVLENVISTPAEWKGLGMRGRLYVEKYHSAENVVQQYIDLYKKI